MREDEGRNRTGKEFDPMGKRSGLAAVVGASLLIVGLAGCGGGGGEGQAEPAPSSAAPSSAAPSSAVPSPSESADDQPLGKKKAHKVVKMLRQNGLPCKWKTTSDEDSLAYTMQCSKREMILAAADEATIPVWLDSVGQQSSGWAIVAKDYAIISPDHSTINHAWDLLGAKGDVQQFGS